MKMTLKKIAILLIYSSGMLNAVKIAAQAPPKLILTQGSTLKIQNAVNSFISQDMMGQPMEMNFNVNSVQKVEVKGKKAKSYNLVASITEMKISGNMMGQDINFDSNKKEDLDSDIGKNMQASMNVPIDVEMGDDAKVIAGAIKPEAQAGAQENPITQMINNMQGGVDDSYGTSAAFLLIPPGLKTGDSWTDSLISPDIKTYHTYTLKSATPEEMLYTMSGTQIVAKQTSQSGMEVLVKMNGNLSGEGSVNPRSGVIRKNTVTTESTGTVAVSEMTIPMTSKVVVVTTVSVL